MDSYLSADELAALIGCRPNSYACMRRYLDRHKWPYAPNLRGFPCVSRDYYKQRMSGQLPPASEPNLDVEPDFSVFSS